MAITQVGICNVALARLGQTPIVTIGEGTVAANYCSALWDSCYKTTLRKHPWNFAVKVALLVEVTPAETNLEWDYVFTAPTDLLRALCILPASDKVEFEVKYNRIFSNQETCNLKYIYLNSTYTEWDDMFADAVAFRLASELAVPITGDMNKQQAFYKAWLMAISDARTYDAREGYHEDTRHRDFIDARA